MMSLIGKWQIINDITLEWASEIQIDAYMPMLARYAVVHYILLIC